MLSTFCILSLGHWWHSRRYWCRGHFRGSRGISWANRSRNCRCAWGGLRLRCRTSCRYRGHVRQDYAGQQLLQCRTWVVQRSQNLLLVLILTTTIVKRTLNEQAVPSLLGWLIEEEVLQVLCR